MRLPCLLRRVFLAFRPDKSPPKSNPERPDVVTVSEVDYFGLANILIDHHGSDAKAEANRLLQAALQEDDPEAVADWLAVEHAITLLTNDSAATRH